MQAIGSAPINLSKTGAVDYNTDMQGTDMNLVLDLNHSRQSVLNFQMCRIVLMSNSFGVHFLLSAAFEK